MKKVRMLGLVQEGAFSLGQLRLIEAECEQLYASHFGHDHRVIAYWMFAPVGQSFVAAKQSKSSAVILPVNDHLPLEARHAFMHEMCALWMKITGCSSSQLVLNVPDHQYVARYMKANNRRYRITMRAFSQLKLLYRFVMSQLRQKCKLISMNMV